MRYSKPILAALAPCLVFAAGCGDVGGRRTVTGTVTLGGRPLAAGTVTFLRGEPPVPAGGALVRDGRFELAGDQGVGKTRLAGLIRDEIAAGGAQVVAVAAGPATRPLPFGALAALLPATVEPAATSQAALSAAVAALAARADDGGLVVAVDDAHHLDDASAAVLHQLAADGTITVRVSSGPRSIRSQHAR